MWKSMEESAVEIEGEDGSKLASLGPQNRVFGRGCCGFHTKDLTVSRRHVSFQLLNNSRVSFQVIGRNPFWVCSTTHGGRSLTLFRKSDKGQLDLGDRFSFSGKAPIWFHFNKPAHNDDVPGSHSEDESSRVDLNIDQIDLSQIDLVKEFGFLVIGHEFDNYPKEMIRNVKDWQWFLEEPTIDSDEDDEGKERRKRKKGKDNEDEEWGGESEEDKDLVSKIRKGKRPMYSTRSKDSKKCPNRDTEGGGTSSKRKKTTNVKDTGEEDDDDDETLGGFIVGDKEDQEEDDQNDEEEEEEFEDEEED